MTIFLNVDADADLDAEGDDDDTGIWSEEGVKGLVGEEVKDVAPSAGAIVGAVFGGIVGLILLIVLVMWLKGQCAEGGLDGALGDQADAMKEGLAEGVDI